MKTTSKTIEGKEELEKCKKCSLPLPPNNKKKYCVSPRHACWCDDELNQWRLDNGFITKKQLQLLFNNSITRFTIKDE